MVGWLLVVGLGSGCIVVLTSRFLISFAICLFVVGLGLGVLCGGFLLFMLVLFVFCCSAVYFCGLSALVCLSFFFAVSCFSFLFCFPLGLYFVGGVCYAVLCYFCCFV